MKMFKLLSFVLVLSAFILAGCSKDDNNPAFPGGGNGGNGGNENPGNGAAAQAEITINGTKFTAALGGAYYVPSEDLTYAGYWSGNANDSLMATVVFEGKELATRSWGVDNSNVYLLRGVGNNQKVYMSGGEGGATIIEEYGNVNGNIKGTFSGDLYEINSGEKITVFSSFTIKRMADQND